MSETHPISENTIKHWILFALAWAEERGQTPIRKETLYEEMGPEAFNEGTVFQNVTPLYGERLIYKTATKPGRYTLSEAGKDLLIDFGPPTKIPTHAYPSDFDRDLSLPDAVYDSPTVPDKLRVRNEWPENAHLLREDPQTGELSPLCESPIASPRFTTSVTPAELDAHADDGGLCPKCTERRVYTEWREQMQQADADAGAAQTDADGQSRWEKYQEWIDSRDFDTDTTTPDEALAKGRVLVSSQYTDAPHPRKLHAYHRHQTDDGKVSDWFSSLCGKAAESEHADALESLDPSSFLFRSDACEICKQHVRESDEFESSGAAAESVEFDPFGVFGEPEADTRIEQAEPEPTADESAADADGVEADAEPDAEPEFVCPDCGRSDFDSEKALSIHWGHPQTDCEYPVPDAHEREVFTGIWLVGGERDGRGTPPMRKTSVNRAALEWLNDQLGMWSGSVKEGQSSETQQANVKAGFDYDGAESKTQYRLTTRACPWLDELAEQDVADIDLTPLIARVLYSFRGHLVDKSAITIRHPDGPGLKECLERAGFEVRNIADPPEGKNQYRLTLSASASREFAEWVEEPLPGFKNKAFEFRESHTHKEGSRTPAPEPTTESESEAESEHVVPETISLEPEWDWVGVQLYKLGLKQFAVRAFKGEMSPAEVYGDGGVEEIIYSAALDEEDYGLDFGSPPGSRTLTLVEQPVPEEEITRIRRELGLENGPNSDNGNGGEATA